MGGSGQLLGEARRMQSLLLVGERAGQLMSSGQLSGGKRSGQLRNSGELLRGIREQ